MLCLYLCSAEEAFKDRDPDDLLQSGKRGDPAVSYIYSTEELKEWFDELISGVSKMVRISDSLEGETPGIHPGRYAFAFY